MEITKLTEKEGKLSNERSAKVDDIKKFLEVEELSKLEQGAVQGGQAQGKQKQKQKNGDDGTVGGPVQN